MDQKKIFILVTEASWGGAQRYVFDLATHLRKSGWAVCVGSGSNRYGELDTLLSDNGVRVVKFPELARPIRPWHDLRSILRLRRFIRSENFAVVHLNSSKAGFVGAIAAKLAGVRCVVFTAHGFVFNEPSLGLVRLFYVLAEKLASLFRDKIITVSEYDRIQALGYRVAPEKKLAVVHNGVSIERGRILSRDEARIKIFGSQTGPGPVVGCIANLRQNKGLGDFLSAAAIVAKEQPEARFVVIGEGELRADLERLSRRLGLEQRLILTGHLPEAEQYLAAFDIYACSSLKEGLSYSLLEALSAGVPVVATRVGGNPEIIRDRENGILVQPDNPRALAEGVLRLLRDLETAENYARRGRETAAKEFSLDKMLNDTISIYETCGS